MVANINVRAADAVNGQIFIVDDADERESYKTHQMVPYPDTLLGFDSAQLSSVDITNALSGRTPQVNYNAGEMREFINDQYMFLRNICNIPAGDLNDDALMELCLLRFLTIKHKLAAPALDPHTQNSTGNNIHVGDPHDNTTPIGQVRALANRQQFETGMANWFNGKIAFINGLTNSYSTIVCILAHRFRAAFHLKISSVSMNKNTKEFGRSVCQVI